MVNEYCGWFLDAYPSAGQPGITLWVLGEDGRRRRFFQRFPLRIYAAASPARLRELGGYLRHHYGRRVRLTYTRRRHLLQPQLLPVLAIEVEHEPLLRQLFHRIKRPFSDVKFFDVNIRLLVRYAAAFDVFPLTRVAVAADEEGCVQRVVPLDSRWDPDLPTPGLRLLVVEPNTDPGYAHPTNLQLRYGETHWQIPVAGERQLLNLMRFILEKSDPDVILSGYGDGWTLPFLDNLARRHRLPLPLNRDPDQEVTRRPGVVFHAFGRTIHRGPQTFLHGRLHIDARNSMNWRNVGLEGIFETARLSGLPLQIAARNSPGAAIAAMLLITALKRELLAPWHKEQSEREKSVLELAHADKGGLIFPPVMGVHENVVEVDFSSMFPMVARVHNISPETVDNLRPEGAHDPLVGEAVDAEGSGLLPAALAPMLDKRLLYKQRLATMPPDDPQRPILEGRLKAQKWIGVVAYGRTKYKEETYARVEVHEAITRSARKSLVIAKITAEEMGFRFLHGYVDALYLQKPAGATQADIQKLLDEVVRRTQLPIVLEGEYHWMAFPSSRRNPRIPAANRFFGLKIGGGFKVRGIEARRNDTPALIARCQMELLTVLGAGRTSEQLRALLPQAVAQLQQQVRAIRRRAFDVQDFVVGVTLSRDIGQYKVKTAAVRAAVQLARVGKKVGAGHFVRYVYTLAQEGVTAWDLPQRPSAETLDVERYVELLLRAAFSVLQPIGVTDEMIRDWVLANAGYYGGPGYLPRPTGASWLPSLPLDACTGDKQNNGECLGHDPHPPFLGIPAGILAPKLANRVFKE